MGQEIDRPDRIWRIDAMRLLIAGWQGQLAQCLVRAAVARSDVTACAVGRPALDICKLPTIHRNVSEVRPDVVINTAAYTAVDKAESERDAAFALNRDGAQLLAEAAAAQEGVIIHLSTDYVFDGRKCGPYVETDRPAPQGAYGASKFAGEEAVARSNERHIILRTAWVYSPHGQNFVRTMLRLGRERDEVSVVDDQRGSPTYAVHLADAVLAIAAHIVKQRHNFQDWGIYHAAGNGEATWYEFAKAIFDESVASGGPSAKVKAIESKDYPTLAPRPANSVLDCRKLDQTFDLRLPQWREGVRNCVQAICKQD